jgi:hypothetical protein
VKAVPSGDCLVIMAMTANRPGPPPEKSLTLASLIAPRLVLFFFLFFFFLFFFFCMYYFLVSWSALSICLFPTTRLYHSHVDNFVSFAW